MLRRVAVFNPLVSLASDMRAIVTLILFFFFLLIRSGNSHEIISDSYRPAISFMQHHDLQGLKAKSHTSTQHHLSSSKSNSHQGSDEHHVLGDENEDKQSLDHLQLQMAMFAAFVCFTFIVLQFGHKSDALPGLSFCRNYNTPLYLTKRSLLI